MTAGFEVEDDLSWNDLRSKRAPDTHNCKIPDSTHEHLVQEYRHLAAYGLSHEKIAQRLGRAADRLTVIVRGAGIQVARDPIDATSERILDELIASGRQFIASQIPDGKTDQTVTGMVRNAHEKGRIRAVGKDVFGYTIWEGVPRDA